MPLLRRVCFTRGGRLQTLWARVASRSDARTAAGEHGQRSGGQRPDGLDSGDHLHRGAFCYRWGSKQARLITIVLALLPIIADARIQRSQQARHEFVRQQACPATGRHRLPCPGWQIDHITPLKCKGDDAPSNMQWLTIQEHKAKTKREARWCR